MQHVPTAIVVRPEYQGCAAGTRQGRRCGYQRFVIWPLRQPHGAHHLTRAGARRAIADYDTSAWSRRMIQPGTTHRAS